MQVLLDVGAGQGYLSLAAAARGRRAVAFETDPVALASLNASLAFNGFHNLVTVHQAGAWRPCLRGSCAALYCLRGRCAALYCPASQRYAGASWPVSSIDHVLGQPCPAPLCLCQVALGSEEEPVCLDMGTADGALAAGYAHPDAHRLEGRTARACTQQGLRAVGQRFVPAHLRVGSLHINAPGWEGWVVQGLQVGLLPRTALAALRGSQSSSDCTGGSWRSRVSSGTQHHACLPQLAACL